MRLSLVLLGAFLASGDAQAEGKLGDCVALQDRDQRLACFDAAAREQSNTPAPPNPAARAEISWSIQEDRSPVDDSPQVKATLISTNGKTALIARCKDKETEVFVAADTFIGSSSDPTVLYRINSEKAITERWSSSTSGRAAFSNAPIALLRVLPNEGSLFVRVEGFRGGREDAQFQLTGTSKVKAAISAACNWKL